MIEEKIRTYLHRQLPQVRDLELLDFRRHTEGWSWETFSFEARWREDGREVRQGYVVRKEPDQAGVIGKYDTFGQFAVLKALEDTPVAAPRVFWYELARDMLGAPFFVMEKVEGTIPLPWAEKEHGPFADAAEQRDIAHQFVENLVHLHAVDWQAKGLSFLGVPEPGQGAAFQEIAKWEAELTRVELTPLPLLRRALVWLKAHAPMAPRVSIVHGDYRLGNFICRDGRIVAMLDWELVHLGDPLEDLGWICLRPWRGRSRYMAALIERAELYQLYESLTGIPVDDEHIRFYEVLGNLKLAVIHLTAARAFEDGTNTDVRLATMGHHYIFMLKHIGELLGL
jgi:aminoglycoside phosphotransferase (APT) family kinase protein